MSDNVQAIAATGNPQQIAAQRADAEALVQQARVGGQANGAGSDDGIGFWGIVLAAAFGAWLVK